MASGSVSLSTCDTQVLARMVVLSADQTAPYFARALTTKSGISAQEVVPQIKDELCVLYLHLLEREVFQREGREARDRFADSLFESLSQHVDMERSQFSDYCNVRQIEYSQYREVMAEDKSSRAGTLLWEFEKKMGLTYRGYNWVALELFMAAVMDSYIELLKAATQMAGQQKED